MMAQTSVMTMRIMTKITTATI